jgi:hypothetical protein
VNVEYWKVSSATSVPLPLSTSEVSSHLLHDWIPSLPAAVGSAFMGWPPFLLEPHLVKSTQMLSLRAVAGRSERQWKGVLSWMLGVAGTRHVLKQEGYQWIAPASAFYPSLANEVDLSSWHPSFPASSVSADRPDGSKIRNRPDYLAIRPVDAAGKIEWAIAEAKGTSWALKNMSPCPPSWHQQVRNLNVVVNGTSITVPRHLVVATRVNPNAKRPLTRCLQIRAWNSDETQHRPGLPAEAAADIASAHLFGVFRNIGMHKSARALAVSVGARTEVRTGTGDRRALREELHHFDREAEDEVRGFAQDANRTDERPSVTVRLNTGFGDVAVEIDQATTSMAAELSRCLEPEEAAQVFRDSRQRFGRWEDRMHRSDSDDAVAFASGVRVRFPGEAFRSPR